MGALLETHVSEAFEVLFFGGVGNVFDLWSLGEGKIGRRETLVLGKFADKRGASD